MALNNKVQSGSASVDITFGFPFVPATPDVIEVKISNRGVGIIGLNDFYGSSYTDGSYSYYFFKRINLLLAYKSYNDSSSTINLGAL
jgi:hypothetical protein